VYTKSHQRSLSWASWIQSTHSYSIFLRFILILSSHLRLGLPTGLFHWGFTISVLLSTCLLHVPLISSWFNSATNYEAPHYVDLSLQSVTLILTPNILNFVLVPHCRLRFPHYERLIAKTRMNITVNCALRRTLKNDVWPSSESHFSRPIDSSFTRHPVEGEFHATFVSLHPCCLHGLPISSFSQHSLQQ
jgi:hypothetical protein